MNHFLFLISPHLNSSFAAVIITTANRGRSTTNKDNKQTNKDNKHNKQTKTTNTTNKQRQQQTQQTNTSKCDDGWWLSGRRTVIRRSYWSLNQTVWSLFVLQSDNKLIHIRVYLLTASVRRPSCSQERKKKKY